MQNLAPPGQRRDNLIVKTPLQCDTSSPYPAPAFFFFLFG